MMVHNKPWHLYTAVILMASAIAVPFVRGELALAVIAAAVAWQFFVLLQSDVRIERKVEGLLDRERDRYGPGDVLP